MVERKRWIKGEIITLLFLCAFVVFSFLDMLFDDRMYIFQDFYRLFYPKFYFLHESIKSGLFPFWNPYILCGVPLIGDTRIASFYPFSFLIYFLPLNIGIKLCLLFQLLLGAGFMYGLLRYWRLSKCASIAGSLSFILSGCSLSFLEFPHLLYTFVWMPLYFLLLDKALSNHRFIYLLLLGVVVGLQCLGGSIDICYIMLLFACGFTIHKTLMGPKKDYRNLLYPMFSLIIGCSLILFQLLPFLEFFLLSNRREGFLLSDVLSNSLNPCELIDLIIPFFSGTGFGPGYNFFFGQQLLRSIYFGILPLCFCSIAALFARKKPIVSFFSFTLLLSVLLSFGRYLPGYEFIYSLLPGMEYIRFPVKFFSFFAFSAGVLCGFGIEWALENIRKSTRVIFVFTLFMTLAWTLSLSRHLIADFLGIFYNLAGREWMFDAKYREIFYNLSMVVFFLSLGVVMLHLLGIKGIKCAILKSALVFIIGVDLLFFGDFVPTVNEDFYHSTSQSIVIIKQDRDYFRIALSPRIERSFDFASTVPPLPLVLKGIVNYIPPSLNILHGIYTISGCPTGDYPPLELIPKDYATLFRTMARSSFSDIHHLLNMLNVRYILSEEKLEALIPLINPSPFLYKNPDMTPRP